MTYTCMELYRDIFVFARMYSYVSRARSRDFVYYYHLWSSPTTLCDSPYEMSPRGTRRALTAIQQRETPSIRDKHCGALGRDWENYIPFLPCCSRRTLAIYQQYAAVPNIYANQCKLSLHSHEGVVFNKPVSFGLH